MSGKAYANRGKVVDNDLYHTPESLTGKLLELEKFKDIWEPASGDEAISNVLDIRGYSVTATDIETGVDFLDCNIDWKGKDIITNPPFFLWDEFRQRSIDVKARKTAFIGRLNYFGSVGRFEKDIFRGCKNIYAFNRMVDYRTPRRKDGLFHVGALVTAWFVWERGYKGYPTIQQVDVQDYAKLGQYRECDYEILDILGISSTWTPDMVIDFNYAMKQLPITFTQYQRDHCNSVGKLLSYCRRQQG